METITTEALRRLIERGEAAATLLTAETPTEHRTHVLRTLALHKAELKKREATR